jgi:hypothetical protein
MTEQSIADIAIGRLKLSSQRETCFRATLSTTNFMWIALELNLGLCSKKLVTNCLSYSISRGKYKP